MNIAKMSTRTPFLISLLAWILVAFTPGCATRHAVETKPVYFPPPPDEPHLQFLTSFSSSQDVAPQSRFSLLVLGHRQPIPIYKPYGLSTSPGRIYVCDSSLGAVEILDLENHKMEMFAPRFEGQMRVPINIAIDTNGTRYVADAGHGQVLIYDSNGSFTGAIGKRNTIPIKGHMAVEPIALLSDEPATNAADAPTNQPPADVSLNDQVMKPTDVAITEQRLYVADMKGHCVRVYDKVTQELLFALPRGTVDEKARLFQPTNLAIDTNHMLYVSDTGGFRVQQYTSEGDYVKTFGEYGLSPGRLALPKGIDVDREGRLYVVDAKAQVAQIFNSEGQLLMYFGEPNASEAPLDLPASVVVDYDNVPYFRSYAAPGFVVEYLVIVCNQYGDRKVSVYGFGHRG